MMSQKGHQQNTDLPEGLAQPARRALSGIGIQRLEQFAGHSEAEIKKLHGIGPNALSQIREALAERGLSFADKNRKQDMTPSQNIDAYIAGLDDWRGDMLARLRALVNESAPELEEQWKWDTPVWAGKGNVLAISAFKDHVKINFFKGASLEDTQGLFNAGLEAKATRAIDFSHGGEIDEANLKELIRAAAAYNASGGKKK